ncbi:MAG: mycothiol synthase [Acidimicrobiales bacterium]
MEGLDVMVVTSPGQSLEREVTTLLHRISDARDHPALGEQKRLSLLQASENGSASGDGHVFVGMVARRAGRPGLCGYAQIDGNTLSGVYAVELVIDAATEERGAIADLLLVAAIAEVQTRGGGTLRYWASNASPEDDARASAHGFRTERNLVQMRCPLPVPEHLGRDRAPSIRTRPFRPGHDEAAWLATNNRAFAAHPEQGQWDLSRLLEREREPWFDPAGFLLLEEEGRLAGSCWTKVHAGAEPPLGEIYVIGVDPAFQGRGWGRALTLAGLDWLAGHGLRTGMLYVDGSNRSAVSMYRSMAFADDHVDRVYVATVDPT